MIRIAIHLPLVFFLRLCLMCRPLLPLWWSLGLVALAGSLAQEAVPAQSPEAAASDPPTGWLAAPELSELQTRLARSRAAGDRLAEVRILCELAEAGRNRGELEAARTWFEASLALSTAHGFQEEQADARLGLASLSLEWGNLEDARTGYQTVLADYRRLQDTEGEALVLGNLGVVAEMTSRYADALELYTESLALKEQVGDRAGVALTLGNVGVVWLMVGDPAQALDWFQRSLTHARALPDPLAAARAQSNLGAALLQLGRFRPAARALEAALDSYRHLGDPVALAETLGNFAALRQAIGDPAGAAEDFQALLDLFRAHQRPWDEAITLHNLGAVLETLGQRDAALEHLEASLARRRALGDRFGEALTLNTLGTTLLRAGKLDEAQARFEAADQLAQEIGAGIEAAKALLGLGELAAARNQTAEAQRRLEDAARRSAAAGDFEVRVAAQRKRGEFHRRHGEWTAAANAYLEALRHIEAGFSELSVPAQQAAFLDLHAPVYHELAQSLVQAGQPLQAWRHLEAGRARALEMALRSSGAWRSGTLTSDAAAQIRAQEGQVRLAQREVAALQVGPASAPERLQAAQTRLDRARAKLLRLEEPWQAHPEEPSALPELWADLAEPPTAALAEAQAVLFLEYLVGEDQTCVFLFRIPAPTQPAASPPAPDPLRVISLPVTARDLQQAVTTFRHRLGIRYPRTPIPEGARLYQWLIAPLREHLRPGDLLCLIPDGVLWELPFQALHGPDGRYLLQDHALAYVPSVRGWIALRQRADRRRRASPDPAVLPSLELAVLANPDLGPAQPSRLPLLGPPVAIPGTEAQGRQIAALYAPHSQIHLGPEATEEQARLLATRARFLHLATHGVYEPASPLFSGVLLAPGPQHDGYWEAREILQTDLRAELVVLSACETARGQVRRGEGLWGLAWALFVAGTPASVLSQWAVADDSTAALMTRFYQHLSQHPPGGDAPGFTKAQALRRAQLDLLEGQVGREHPYAHPFYWAPFILLGDWR